MSTFHIVRASDDFYALTVRGTREDAERAAHEYTPNPWTAPEDCPAYVVPAEPDYPATVEARAYGDGYADQVQRNVAELLARHGIDRRGESLSALLVRKDGV